MGKQRQEVALTHHKGSFPPQHRGRGTDEYTHPQRVSLDV